MTAEITQNHIQLVSQTEDGVQGNGESSGPSVSKDGRYVAFDSEASNLISNDINGDSEDVFRKDLTTGELKLVNVRADGVQSNGGGEDASISGDGSVVGFESWATDLDNGAYVQGENVYVTELDGDGGVFAIGSGSNAAMALDGRHMAFTSENALVGGDTNGRNDVYFAAADDSPLRLVSTNAAGVVGDGESEDASISADGRYVAFAGDSTNLVPGVELPAHTDQIFVKDTVTGTVILASCTQDGAPGNLDSEYARISADGRHVVFTSIADNFGDGFCDAALYWKNLDTGELKRVAGGVIEDMSPSISADGRYVAFASYASTLVAGDTNNTMDVFIMDMETNEITRVSTAADGTQGNAVSFAPAISADGGVVAFASLANNLVAGDNNHNVDVFAVQRDIVVANDDTFETTYDAAVTGSVFVQNGGSGFAQDYSTFDRNFTVGKVNGVEANVGQQVTLASGALLTLNANGTFSYDPNHAFDGCTDPQTDSFTYAILDNLGHHDHATVTLSLSAPHIVTEINGTEGNDSLIGTAGDDIINARGGHDYVEGASGADTIYGGDGDDSLYGGAGADVIEGGAGNDYLRSGDSNGNWDEGGNTLRGGAGNDTLDVYGNNNVLEDDEGDDNLYANGQRNTLNSGTGDDYIYVNGNENNISGGADADIIQVSGSGNTISGGDGNDSIQTYNYMYYGSGGNTIDAGAGDDRVNLSGYYMMMGGSSSDIVTLGEGRDTIGFTSSPSMTFLATVTDFATGASGDKVDLHKILYGLGNYNGGNPFGDGHIRLFQDGGDTLLQVAQYGNGYDTGFTTLLRFQNTTVANFTSDNFLPAFSPDGAAPVGQTIDGTDGDDIITGTAGDDIINARGGNDHVDGSAGADAIYGGDGNDTLYGGLGSDTLEGGAGDDYLSSGNGSDYGNWTLDTGNTLRGGTGADELDAYGTNNVVEGDEGNDYLYIGGEGNAVSGGANDDYIQVNGNSNIVGGGSGNDYVYVSGGGNTISGGDGNDTIQSYSYYAASGNTIDAGAGDDQVYLSNYYMMVGGSAETVTLGEGRDTIGLSYVPSMTLLATVTDFAPGTDGDKVDLNQILSGLGNYGGANPFGDGHIQLVQDGDDTLLQVDQYGNSDGANFTTLLRLQNTTVADFTADNFLPGFNPDGSAPAPVDEYLVSQTWYGAEGDRYSLNPVISADGQWVAFESNAHNLVSPDNNPYDDILVKNLSTGEIIRASTNALGEQANGDCESPSISADGSKIAFLSWAGNLVPGVNPNGDALFVKNLSDGSITCVAQGVEDACISRDGQYVTFSSYGNLIPGDTNGTCSIYRARTDGTEIRLVSANASGQADNGEAQYSTLSGDGRFVLFASNSTNLVEGHDSGLPEYYLKDMDSGVVTAVAPVWDHNSGNEDADYRGAISADGRYVVFDSFSNTIVPGTSGGALYWKDLQTSETKLVTDGIFLNLDKFKFSISGDGNLVSFTSYASTLVEGDTNNTIDAFVKNMTTGEVQRVDVPSDGGQANAFAIGTSIADDGAVAFASFASNLVEGDDNGLPDVFVTKPVFTGEVYVAEPEAGTAYDNSIQQISNYSSGPGSISANGQYVAFQTSTFGDGVHDAIYVRDLVNGANTLVSTSTGGGEPNNDAFRASLSADGQRVVFASDATDIVAGAGVSGQDAIYIKDLVSQETRLIASGTDNARITADGNHVVYGLNGKVYLAPAMGGAAQLVSTNLAGEPGDGEDFTASASADGRYIAFVSTSTNLAGGDTNGVPDVFVKDMLTGNVERVASVYGDSFAGLRPGGDQSVLISGDGRHVVFASFAPNIIPGVEGGALFWKDLDTHEVKLVSTGVADAGDFHWLMPSMSTDGRYVAFQSYASELVPGDTNNSIDVFVMDMSTGNVKRVSTAADGTQGNALSMMPSLSGDGSTVTFLSLASNLVAGDGNGHPDVFVARTGFGEANPDNHAPTVTPYVATFTEDALLAQGPGNLLLAVDAQDADNDVLSVVNVDNEIVTTGGEHFVRGVDYTVADDGGIALTDVGIARVQSMPEGASETFTLNFGVTDGIANTPACIIETITGVNDAPNGNDDYFATTEDSTAVGNVLENDTDIDGDALSVTAINDVVTAVGTPIALASGATLLVNANGDMTYDPNGAFDYLAAGQTAADKFSYTVSDGAGGEVTKTAHVTVNGVTDYNPLVAPLVQENSGLTFVNAEYSGAPGAISPFGGLNLGSVEGQPLTLGAGVLLTTGSASIPDSNTQPSFTGDNGTPGYAPLQALLSGLGVGNATYDASVLTVTFTTNGELGAAQNVSIDVVFGSEEFPEYVNDYVDIAGVFVDGVNYALFDANSTSTPLSVLATNVNAGYFLNNDYNHQEQYGIPFTELPIEYNGLSRPLTITGALNPNLTEHTIVVAIADTQDHVLDSGIFISNLHVTDANTGINMLPNAVDDAVAAADNAVTTFDLLQNDTDPDGNALGITEINGTPVSNGTSVHLASGADVTLNADGTVSYNPNSAFEDLNAGETGEDSFTYSISDGHGGVDAATVNVSVNGGNDENTAPTVEAIEVAFEEDTEASGNLLEGANAQDADGDTLTVVAVDDTVTTTGGRDLVLGTDFTVATDGSAALTAAGAAKFNDLGVGQSDSGVLNFGVSDGTDTTMTTLTVTVTGMNDTPTAGTLDNVSVHENSAAGTLVGTLGGVDPDADDTLSYSLIDDAGGRFAIADGNQLVVGAGGTLDHEETSAHSVVVRITDASGAVFDQTFAINVENVNETPDSLSLDGGNVSEMATAGTVVGTLTASDPDAGDAPELEFALSDNAGGRFEIVGNEIRLADGVALDYEATNSYQIAVDVTDAGGLTRTETFTINVTNEDEAPTAITMQGGSVAENSAAGTVAAELGVNDPDGPGTYNYAIINDPSGLFTLDGNKVVVAEGANLDYETATSHTLRVQVTDWSGLSYEQDITIAVEDVNPHIIGTNASNVLTGTVETDLIEGLGGNDTLNGGVNVDTLVGGTGNDTYVIDDRDEDVTTELAGEGTDTVQLGATYADASYHLQENIENLTALGSSGIALYGNALDNRLTGNSGNDTLDGGAGADTMTGGAGDDIYYVDNAGDRVTETGGGTDEVRTALAAYSMASMSGVENLSHVGAGNFSGTGNSLANTMTGGSGADRLDGKTGADTLIGLYGNDVYVVDNAGDIVVEVADGGTDTVESSISYTLGDGVENLALTGTRGVNGTGNALDNLITGNSGANILDGGAGTDTLAGGAGNDTYLITDFADIIEEEAGQGTDTVSTALDHFSLAAIDNVENLTYTGSGNFTGTGNALANAITGGSGNDVLDGGAGADTLRGGAGDDTYYVDNTSDRVYENSGAGVDTVSSSINFTLGSNQENLVLTGAAVAGTGNGLANTLTGSDIANTLTGGAGGDRLIGNGGDDTLTGGSAADTFVFAPGFGHDTITDFSATGATHDILEFDASIFGGDLNVLLANAEQVGSNVTITIDADTSVTLQHVNKTALNSTNTHFVSDFDFT